MSGEIAFLSTAVPVFLSIFVPGFLLALALLRKTKMPLAEIAAFGFVVGLIVPPVLLFVYSLFGVLYSPQLAVGNIILVTIVGFILCTKENVLDFELSFDYKRDAAWILLLLIMLLAFWVRIQSIGPIFYEFDPYYYDQGAQFILTQGEIPTTDDLAWYPHPDSHRDPPIVRYLEVEWYSIYGYMTGNQQFNNYLLSTIAGVYPPVVGALICFLVFMLISEEYGKKYGLIGAALMAVMPRIIEKFAAGESELQPWGIFAAFFFYSTYALAVSRKDRRFAVLAGIAVMAATLGSSGDVLVYLVLAGYVGLQSLINYFQNKSNRELIELNAIILCFSAFTYIVYSAYVGWVMPSDILSFASALAFAVGLYFISQRVKRQEDRINYLAGYLTVGGIFLLITFASGFPLPVGPRIWNYVVNAASIARPSSALMMTVAEETPTSGDFANSMGFLGSSTWFVDILFLSSFLAICYSIYRGSSLGVLFGMMIFPVSYVGLSKSKYMLHVSFMAGVAVTMLFGELDKKLHKFIKKDFGDDAAKWTVVGVALLVLAAESLVYVRPCANCFIEPDLSIPGPLVDVVTGALDSKYELKDPAYASEMGRNCSALANNGNLISYYLFCSRIPAYWRDPMDWIKDNVGENDRVISWWDYGHWINYWGQKKCITRNDHKYQDMDLEVADKFVSNTPQALKEYMLEHNAKYVLFDQDLVGKWGALNFLSCVYNNETSMDFAFKEGIKYGVMYQLSTSRCEAEHNFERIAVPVNPTIADFCEGSGSSAPLVRARSTLSNYTYCIRYTNSSAAAIAGIFYEYNLSRVNRGIPVYGGIQSSQGKSVYVFTMFYTNDVWPDGKTGWEDRVGKMYDSTFYQGFILGNLPGFEQVYPESNQSGLVRIFKIIE
ncbi:MAG: hypothetical protein NTY73_03310 [Candidatus Micrarchaeota archaeon]|nr:hypothetical protein [Candidatus Micrarchaeota archaeon]